MKNLYKKIYEAINTGIQKALVLDDEEDVSIIYQHKKIVNNENLMFHYVDILLQDSDNEYNYKQIIKYYENTEYTYKVKDFDELRNIFDKIKDIEYASFEWIENMKDYISIVLKDKSEINFYEETDKNPLFLKFANDDILNTENEILIYLYDYHCIPNELFHWQTKYIRIQDDKYLINDENYGSWVNAEKAALKDYSGYETCLRIYDIVLKDPDIYGEIPAIDYCLKLNINGYQGYLPSMGQLMVMYDNIDMINYVFKYLKLNEIEYFNGESWWSSTEINSGSSWHLDSGSVSDSYGKVSYDGLIFPLFTVKKN
ncbi:MAG: hypothetical protein [Wendovervirus sonii]|uniref:Uncharacterized protein n=1 Tax=phage Lak_Megaphage_Sonny TaxID=3109229 RepID=A0ABZ0Z4B0_9CAUD|nr:MAG: hypothetical protein [phage Lak_Megaphage_Sonny]